MANRISTVLDLDGKSWSSGFKSILTDMGNADGLINKLKTGWKGVTAEFKNSSTAQAAAVGGLVVIAQQSIQAASDLEESVNAVKVSYGDAADEVLALGEDSAASFGMSKSSFNEFATQFSAFANGIAQASGREVSSVVEEMTTRVADFASVMNLDVPEAARIFQSALAGETEPIRKFGVDLSAAAVAAHAVETGIADSAKEMTEAQKVQARYSLLMQATNKVSGDFANTSDGLANSTRIAKANFEDFQASLGQTLIPVVATAVDQLNELAQAAEKVKDGFGLLPDPVENAVGKIALYPAALANAIEWQIKFPISAAKTVGGWFGIGDSAEKAAEGTETWIDASVRASVEAARQQAANEAVGVSLGRSSTAQRDYEESLLDGAAAARASKKAAEEKAEADQLAADAAAEHRDRVDELYASLMQLVGGDIAVREANRAASEAVGEYRTAVKEGKSSVDELRASQDNAASAILRAAQAAADNEIATRTAAGESLSAAAKTDIQRDALNNLAQTLEPGSPLRAQIQGYVDDLGAVPDEVRTAMRADVDAASLAAAEAALLELARERVARVQVRLAGGTLTNDGAISFGGNVVARADGGPVPGPRGAPVPIIAHGGEHVLSEDVVDAIKRGGKTRGLGADSSAGSSAPQHFDPLAIRAEARRWLREEIEMFFAGER